MEIELKKLAKKNDGNYYVELVNGELSRVEAVIIKKDTAVILTSNGRWSSFFADESIDVVRKDYFSSNNKA